MAYTTIDKPSDYFNTILRSGTGSSVTGITGVGFQPDWIWQKRRDDTSDHHLTDSVRGATKLLYSSSTTAEQTNSGFVQSIDSDGFTMGANDWPTSATVVAWNWLAGGTASSNTDGSITSTVSANTTAGFSIVSFTGTGSNATVGHGLSQEPDILIIKNRSVSNRWLVYTKLIDGTFDFLQLNTGDAKTNSSVTPFTSSVFSVINNADSGTSGNNYIAYAFHSVKAYSKMGIYKGNGSADGTFVYTGFKPAVIIAKLSSGSSDWRIYDNKRLGYNVDNNPIRINDSRAEETDDNIDFLSNGFKWRTTDGALNGSGSTYIYMAFASNPFVSSTGIPTTAR